MTQLYTEDSGLTNAELLEKLNNALKANAELEEQFSSVKKLLADSNEQVALLTKMLSDSQKQVTALSKQSGELSQQIANLTETLNYFKKQLFGSKSEMSSKTVADVSDPTSDEAEDSSKDENQKAAVNTKSIATETETITYTRKKKERKPKSTRDELYASLPVVEEYHPLTDEEKICEFCGSEMEHLGWQCVREEIRIKQAEVVRVKILQETAKCNLCDKEDDKFTYIKSEVPDPLINHSNASASVVAYIMWLKYGLYLPTYRQEKSFQQLGAIISRATMSRWIYTCSEKFFEPIYERLHELAIMRDILHADETTCQVLHEEGRTAEQTSYMWLYCTAVSDGLPVIALYDYQPGRGGYHAKNFLKEFSGYLVCDGYGGYNVLTNVIRCACLVHIRRKWRDAIPSGKAALNKELSAVKGYTFFNDLFELERQYQDDSPEERKAKRIKDQEPLWKEFKEWLDTLEAAGGSKLDSAIKYTRNQWPYVQNYMLDGRIPLANQAAENSARPYAVGRKNFLFHSSVKGARSAAVVLSIIETAKRNNLNVLSYLTHLLTEMPGQLKNGSEGIDDLLPWSESMQKAFALN